MTKERMDFIYATVCEKIGVKLLYGYADKKEGVIYAGFISHEQIKSGNITTLDTESKSNGGKSKIRVRVGEAKKAITNKKVYCTVAEFQEFSEKLKEERNRKFSDGACFEAFIYYKNGKLKEWKGDNKEFYKGGDFENIQIKFNKASFTNEDCLEKAATLFNI